MLEEERYKRPLDLLIGKHEDSYRRHLASVVVAKEAEAQGLTREIALLERDRILSLEPALRRAREELGAVSRKAERVRALRSLEEENERLTWKATELEREVRDLHASWSWRITGPLRRLYSRVRGTR